MMNNFFSGGSQIRNSFDKVISYDTSSLVDGLAEKKTRHKRNDADKYATVVPRLRRPATSQVKPKVV